MKTAVVFNGFRGEEKKENNPDFYGTVEILSDYGIERVLFLPDPKLKSWYASSQEWVFDELAGVDIQLMLGASAGGFAALWFGLMMKVPRVLAFSPQTVLDPDTVKYWLPYMKDEHYPPPLDVNSLLPAPGTEIGVVFAGAHPQDTFHANRLLQGHFVEVEGCDKHNVAHLLKQTGELKPLMKELLDTLFDVHA